MTRTKPLSRLTLAISLALGANLLLANVDAFAHQRPAVANKAARGDHTRQTVRQRTENGHTRSDTWTNAQGKTVTRDAEVVRDKEAGTRTRDVVTTLPDGRTRTVNDVTQRTENGFTRDTTITNPNGSTLQRDVTVTVDKETKTVTKDVSVDRTPPPAPAP
jgi:hypothetical protein